MRHAGDRPASGHAASPRADAAPSRAEAALGAAAAGLAAGAAMLLLRSTLAVRSLPERLMEWLLLFVPPALFEAALRRFGFDAKRYALLACIGVVLLMLAGVGYVGLRRGWSVGGLAGIGLGFWLLVMFVIMPLTAAGVFATALLGGATAPTVLGYLAVGLSLAVVLCASRAAILVRHGRPVLGQDTSRRTALALLGGGLAAYVGSYATGLLAPDWRSSTRATPPDPQEPALSGGLEPPNPHPRAVAADVPAPAPTAAPAATATAAGPPEPVVTRGLARDKDGAVLPAGRARGELASALTSNADFYVVTKNAVDDPLIHPQEWRLLVEGQVAQPIQLDYSMLRSLPAVEAAVTLECISNMVGQPQLAPFGAELISTAVWRGARVRDILALAGGPRPGAGWLAVVSADEFTTALPLAAVMNPAALVAYEMNGEVLPREHGYPARLLVPGRYGMKSPKWVVGLRLVQREFLDWYAQRSWSRDGVVKTMTRIDLPVDGASLAPSRQPLAGIAYAGSRGIARVEYSADGGTTWHTAELLEAPGPDRWVRWRGEFELPPGGTAELVARATDGVGNLQVESFSLPQPDGGSGWPTLQVHAT